MVGRLFRDRHLDFGCWITGGPSCVQSQLDDFVVHGGRDHRLSGSAGNQYCMTKHGSSCRQIVH